MKADYVHKDTLTAIDYVELNKKNKILISYDQELLKENKSLKKQLEEYQLQNIDLRADIMIQKKAFPHKEIKDKTFYDLYNMPTYEDLLKQLEEYKQEKQEWINLLVMFKNQQKEFIDWLESYLKLFDNKDIYEEGYYDCIEEILSKYKSIIGGKIE